MQRQILRQKYFANDWMYIAVEKKWNFNHMLHDFPSRYRRREFSWLIIRFEVARRNESRGVSDGRTHIFRTSENRGIEKPRGRERECALNRTKDDTAKREGREMRVCKFTTCTACSRRGVCARIRRLSRTHTGIRGGSERSWRSLFIKEEVPGPSTTRRSYVKLFGRINFPDSRHRHRLWPHARDLLILHNILRTCTLFCVLARKRNGNQTR